MSRLARIILTPRGDYSSNANYVELDWVRYNGGAWVCKKNCSGITPEQGQYWAFLVSDLDSQTRETIFYDELEELEDPSDTDVIPIKNDEGYKKTLFGTLKTKFWTYVQSQLAAVATSGDYDDLTGKPTFSLSGNTLTITM